MTRPATDSTDEPGGPGRPAGPAGIAGLLAAGGLFLTLVGPGGCDDSDPASRGSPPTARLTLLFQVDSLDGPESVAWDSARHRYLVTNVNGPGDTADGNGYVLPVSADGREQRDRLIGAPAREGSRSALLDAPKGIVVAGHRAYVADLHRLVAIDLRADTLLFAREIQESRFLNDVAVGPDGDLYVTDTHLDAVFRLPPDGHRHERMPSAGSLRSPNGVTADPDGGGILLAGWEGAIVRLEPGGTVVLLAEPRRARNLDGIQTDQRGGVVYSDFTRGVVERLAGREPGGWETPERWLDGLETPADLLLRDSVLAVPELDADRIRFYLIEWEESR